MPFLPQRRSIRLKGYDYSQPNLYFVTVCTQNRECLFGNITNDVGVGRDRPVQSGRDRPVQSMELNKYGIIAKNVLDSLSEHHAVKLDIFQIMPNHIHFILNILSGTNPRAMAGVSRHAPTLGFVVGMFKTECTKQINQLRQTPGSKIFQRNYYERIIRNEKEYFAIRQYILENPNNWAKDRNNLV